MSGARPVWARLRVADADTIRSFYVDLLGLEAEEGDGEIRLAPPGGDRTALFLEVAPGAPPAGSGTTGLYHVAFRVPRREDLARMYRHLRFSGVEIRGAADHQVSEALYFSDPEGNGVEVYADRPEESWTWEDGEVRMTTDPLDGNDLLATTDGEAPLPEGSEFGHLHLRTADLERSEEFWTIRMGLEVTTRSWQGALFLASDRYHHHLGLNSWGGPLERAPGGSTGLVGTGWSVPGIGEEQVMEDPDGNRVTLLPG